MERQITAIFKRRILRLILQGRKTQTRRTSKHEWKIGEAYGVRDEWFTKTQGHITITRKFKQRLGDISPKDVQKEGYRTLEEFREAWTEIYSVWNPEQVVTAYEFKTAARTGKPSSA